MAWGDAGAHGLAVQVHCAGPAHTLAAAEARAGQATLFAQPPQQRVGVLFGGQSDGLLVELQFHALHGTQPLGVCRYPELIEACATVRA